VGSLVVENDGNAEACSHCCCQPCRCHDSREFEAFYWEDEAAYEDWLFDTLWDPETD